MSAVGQYGVPSTGVSAVQLTFTVLDATSAGNFSAGASDGQPFGVMRFDAAGGGVTTNSAVVPVSSSGQIQFSSSASVNVNIDIQGYYTSGNEIVAPGGFSVVSAARLADSDSGVGMPKGALSSGSTTAVQLGGAGGIPLGASAAFVNFQVNNAGRTGGYINPFAKSDGSRPGVALNFSSEPIASIAAIVPLDAAGKFYVFLSSGSSINLKVDVQGYFSAGSTSGFHSASTMLLDTRSKASLSPGQTITVPVGGVSGLPSAADGLTSVSLYFVVFGKGSTGGYIRAWASGTSEPMGTSTLSYGPGVGLQTSNTATVGVGADDSVSIHNVSADTIDLVVQTQGYYGSTAVSGQTPIKDQPVALAHDQRTGFADTSGEAIAIGSNENQIGERYLSGVEASGAPVAITLYDATSTQAAPLPVEDNTQQPSVAVTDENAADVTTEIFSQSQAPVDSADLNGQLATATTSTTATVAWAGAWGTIAVYRDGSRLTSVDGSSYQAVGLTPETTYIFRVEGARDTGTGTPTDFSIDIPLTTLSQVFDRTSGAMAKTFATTAAATSYQKVSTEFVYGTFIPDARVGGVNAAVCTFNLNDAFAGDNRSWKKPDGTAGYRTGMQVVANWRDGTLKTTKWDNPSILYHQNGTSETRRASTANMHFEDKQMGGAYAQVRFNHRAGNPFCIAGAITYNVVVRLYRGGLVEVVGNRYPVPNHEGWVRWDGTYNWNNVFKYSSEGFQCLTGICGSRSVSAALNR